VKLKYGDHRIRTRQARLPRAVSDTDAIFHAATELLGRFEDLASGIRLTGVSASQFSDDPGEDLFPDVERARRERLATTTQALRERFGTSGLTRASLLSD
jgi:hypothetical protein